MISDTDMTARQAWTRFHSIVKRIRPIAKELKTFASDIKRGHLADAFSEWDLAWGWGDVNILYNALTDDFGHDIFPCDPFSGDRYEDEE